ncbi:hypothetical protein [Pseudomonas antarctica]|uniref:hypothetical protein n=1 Tax=Pseudomonas antarctica TaxID=219572 RepID=UPI00387B4FE2
MKSPKFVSFQDDWGGGRLLVGDVRLVRASQIEPGVAIFRASSLVGSGLVVGDRPEQGSDYDHDHNQNWTAFDLSVTLPPSGVGVSIRELIRQGFTVAVQLVEDQ